jgi:hypothetical protein
MKHRGPRLLAYSILFTYGCCWSWLVPDRPERLVQQRVIEEHAVWVYVYGESVQQHQQHSPFYY